MSSETLTQTVFLCGDLPRSQSPSRPPHLPTPQMIHLKCLAVRTLDSRHVNMNHATAHTATAVLFAGLLLLAQSDAQLPVTCGGRGMMRPETHAGFLELQSAERPGSVTGQFYRNGKRVKVFCFYFFISRVFYNYYYFIYFIYFYKSPV